MAMSSQLFDSEPVKIMKTSAIVDSKDWTARTCGQMTKQKEQMHQSQSAEQKIEETSMAILRDFRHIFEYYWRLMIRSAVWTQPLARELKSRAKVGVILDSHKISDFRTWLRQCRGLRKCLRPYGTSYPEPPICVYYLYTALLYNIKNVRIASGATMKRRPCHVKKRQYFAYSALSLSGRKLDKMLNFFFGGGGAKRKSWI
jgi:hypothetical protein